MGNKACGIDKKNRQGINQGSKQQGVKGHKRKKSDKKQIKKQNNVQPQQPIKAQYLYRNVAIKSKACNRILDVCQDDDAKGILIIYQDFKCPNQRFDIVKIGDSVRIISCQNGNYLTVGSNSEMNCAPIFSQPVISDQNILGQKFRLAQAENDKKQEFFIYTFCGKVLDCYQNSRSNGTRVVQNAGKRQQDQKWIIIQK